MVNLDYVRKCFKKERERKKKVGKWLSASWVWSMPSKPNTSKIF